MGSSDEAIAPHDVSFNPYTPITSLGRELGILFGFLGSCIATIVLYYFFWQIVQRRNVAKETARVEALVARARAAEAEKRRANGHAQTRHVRDLSENTNSDTTAAQIGVPGMGVAGLEVGGTKDLVV